MKMFLNTKSIVSLLALAVFLIGATSNVKSEDTTHVEAMNLVDMTWWGYDTAEVVFPNQSEEFRRINMNFKLSCPSVGCNRFDYTVKIEVWKRNAQNELERYEMGRVMTPFGIGLPVDWNFTYTFDVTDYEQILRDSAYVVAFFGGYPDDGKWWVASVDFDFIHGTPPRDVLSTEILYRSGPGGFRYGDQNDPIENHLVPTTLTTASGMQSAKLRMVASGHGFGNNSSNGNPDNCAEFCAKNFFVQVDNDTKYATEVWRDDCGDNPVYDQGGTWIYNRGGWCPGSYTERYDHEIGQFINGNSFELDVDWDTYVYTGGSGFPINYMIDCHVFQYGDYNFTTNAALEEILAPNNKSPYVKRNPICSNPRVLIKNEGAENLTSCDIIYGVKGADKTFTYRWQGNLAFGEMEEVTLVSNGFVFANSPSNTFEVRLENPNGKTDEQLENNALSSEFETADVFPNEVMIWGNTNAAPENEIQLIDERRDTIFKSGILPASSVIRDTLSFEDGCYILRLEDFDPNCDGLDFFANNDGVGNIRLHKADGTLELLHTYPSGFGCFAEKAFVVGSGYSGENPEITSIQKQIKPLNIQLYPNPANEQITLDFSQHDATVDEVQIFNVTGQLISSFDFEIRGSLRIDTKTFETGAYFIHVFKDDMLIDTKKFIKH